MAARFDWKKRLGAGNFGEVWLAVDLGLGVQRAVKLIPPDKVLDPANFFHEAQILKAAEHPNVVRVEETGKLADGRIYVAMEYLPRGSVEDETKGAHLDLTRAKRLMVDVLRGLEHAHSKRIIHRDIKPGNILIGRHMEGKLSDFGLAIPVGADPALLGSKPYAYMLHLAPEVYSTGQFSVSTDIYACGVTLYRLVNGDSFLPHVPSSEIRQRALNGVFPERDKYREFITRPMKTLINRAMNIEPSRRFKSAESMRRALEQVVVEKNWNERVLPSGMVWTCSWDRKCFRVSRKQQPDGTWVIAVMKGRSKKSLRHITKFCSEGMSKKEAVSATKRILQDFVLGRLP